PVENAEAIKAQEMQADGDDDDAGNRRQDRQELAEDLAESGGGGAQRHEYHGEAQDEEDRGDGDAQLQPPADTRRFGAQLVIARTAHIGEIGRHQGQHAGAEKAQYARTDDQRQGKFQFTTLL